MQHQLSVKLRSACQSCGVQCMLAVTVLLHLHRARRQQWGADGEHTCSTAADAKNRVLGFWTPYIATVLLIWSGEALTGPSMNPAYTFAWHFQMQVMSILCMCVCQVNGGHHCWCFSWLPQLVHLS